jgi:hypothetical protein
MTAPLESSAKQTQIASAGFSPHPAMTNRAFPSPRAAIPSHSSAGLTGRFWQMPFSSADSPIPLRGAGPRILSCCYRDGKLWMEARYDRGLSGGAVFVGLNLETFDFQTVEFEGRQLDSITSYFAGGRRFDVDAAHLYLSLPDNVERYSFAKKTWEPFALAGSANVIRAGSRTFFVSSNSILEYAAGDSIQVLASRRRRPAVTALDTVKTYSPAHVFLDANAALNVCAGNEVYRLPAGASDWQSVGKLPPPLDWPKARFFDEGFIVPAGVASAEFWGMGRFATEPQLLFRQTPRFGPVLITRNAGPPHWKASPPDGPFCLDNDCIWFLTAEPPVNASPGNDSNSLWLVRFKYGNSEPISIAINLPNQPEIRPATLGMASTIGRWILQSTPDGLVIIPDRLPGLWLIPRGNLEYAASAVEHPQPVRNPAPSSP